MGNTTPQAFRALLRYLYTNELRFADEQLFDAMRKAKEISLDRVYIYIARRVRQSMSLHNVVGCNLDHYVVGSPTTRWSGATLVGSTRTPRPARRWSCWRTSRI